MLPDSPPPSLPEHLVKVYRQLKGISSDEVECRISYQIADRKHPDFLVIYKGRRAFLLAVSAADTAAVERGFRTDLLAGSTPDLLDLPQSHSLGEFMGAVLEDLGKPDLPIQQWILFPKASDAAVNRLGEAWRGPPREFLGKTQCRSGNLLRRFEGATDARLDQESLNIIVGHFAPEASIPASWIARAERAPGPAPARQCDFFLDFDQESAMKRDLELSAEASEAASRGSTRLITGTAGCGKTLILLFRARLSSTLDENQRVLVLMHNKPLRSDLEARARELRFHGSIEWRTFFSWIRANMEFDLIPPWDAERFLEEAIRRRGWERDFTAGFLRDEFEWISDNAIGRPTREWYLGTNRTGRKRGLQTGQRERVHELYVEYRKFLERKRLQDWPTLPRRFLKALREGKVKIPPYDTIYIDEAQFFAPVWFECVRRVLHPARGRLFLVADPTQGFLRSGQSWAQVLGSEIRGRTHRLSHPYRNTRQIMAFARRFYLSRAEAEEDEVNLPDETILSRMPEGDEPKLLRIANADEEFGVLAGQLLRSTKAEGSAGNLLVIDASGNKAEPLVDRLRREIGDFVVEADKATNRRCARVATINACTGIEAPAVALIGVDRLLEREAGLGLDDSERAQLVLRNTKKLFVAMTRAARSLVIVCRDPKTEDVLSGRADGTTST